MSTRPDGHHILKECRGDRRSPDGDLQTLIAEAVFAALAARPTLLQSVPVEVPKERLIRLPEVMDRTGLKRSTLYNRVAAGEFPPQVDLGGNVVAWRESEIDAWIANRL